MQVVHGIETQLGCWNLGPGVKRTCYRRSAADGWTDVNGCLYYTTRISASTSVGWSSGKDFDDAVIGGLVPRARNADLIRSIITAVREAIGRLPVYVFIRSGAADNPSTADRSSSPCASGVAWSATALSRTRNARLVPFTRRPQRGDEPIRTRGFRESGDCPCP